jgi:DNA-binding CsgD family transcriptional regulator
MRVSDIVFSAFGGLVVGGVLIMGLMRLPAIPATVILVLSGLGCGLLLAILDPEGKAYRADGLPNASQVAAFPWFATVMFAISGFLGSAFYGVSGALGWNASGQVNYPLFGIAIVLVLGLTAYIAMQGEETAVATWIPLFGLLLLAMALACFDDPAVSPSVEALLFAAVFSYHFLRWMVFPILVSFSNMPRLFICGIILLATSSFFGVGWGTSTAAILPAGLRDQSGFVAVAALMLLIVFAAALFVNRTRLETARMQLDIAMNQVDEANGRIVQLAKRIQEEPEPQHTLEDRCNALGEAFGLTTRELEILLLTARGHSSTFIAEQLFISASTVRFHQQNIYRKLDVHSRQELLAKVNEEAE